MGACESLLASLPTPEFNKYLAASPIGFGTGEQGPYRLLPRRGRRPDVAFVGWNRLSGKKLPTKSFNAGLRLVRYVDPEKGPAEVYTSPTDFERLDADSILDGRDVPPSFKLKLRDGFSRCRGPLEHRYTKT